MRTNRFSRRLLSIAACTGGALFNPAHAAEVWYQDVYVGIQAGESKLYNPRHRDNHGKIVSNIFTREWTDQSSNSLSAKIGYWVFPYIALEASYWDFGEGTFNEQRVSGGSITNSVISARYLGVATTAKGYAAGAVISYPWRNWRVSAKFAALKNEVRNSGVGTQTTTLLLPPGILPTTSTVVLQESFKDTAPIYGASLSYTFADHFVVEADWRTAKNMGEQMYFGGLSTKVLGLGLQYRF